MLFNNTNMFLESDKERNLYFKIFSGCIFNELIPDNKLGKVFIEKLIDKYKWTSENFKIKKDTNVIKQLENLILDFNFNRLNVTFDFHQYRAINTSDRGEMADILISGNDGFVSIEVKYESDYEYNKDILTNGIRILKASEQYNCLGMQVLLITKTKLLNSMSKENQIGSNYKRLYEYANDTSKAPFILMLWEDVLEVISKDKRMNNVCDFLAQMIDINTNWSDFNTCPFAEDDWGLFSYNLDDNKDKIYSIVRCNIIDQQCNSLDPTFCVTNSLIERCQK